MAWWMVGKESEGSASGSSSQDEEERGRLYEDGGGKVDVSLGRIMPSSRR
jgi:hypothetical protein